MGCKAEIQETPGDANEENTNSLPLFLEQRERPQRLTIELFETMFSIYWEPVRNMFQTSMIRQTLANCTGGDPFFCPNSTIFDVSPPISGFDTSFFQLERFASPSKTVQCVMIARKSNRKIYVVVPEGMNFWVGNPMVQVMGKVHRSKSIEPFEPLTKNFKLLELTPVEEKKKKFVEIHDTTDKKSKKDMKRNNKIRQANHINRYGGR